jgi:hypothetical protein
MQVLFVVNCRVSKDGKGKLITGSEASGMFRQQLNIPTHSVGLRLNHQMRSTGLLMTQDPHREHSHYYELKEISVGL